MAYSIAEAGKSKVCKVKHQALITRAGTDAIVLRPDSFLWETSILLFSLFTDMKMFIQVTKNRLHDLKSSGCRCGQQIASQQLLD